MRGLQLRGMAVVDWRPLARLDTGLHDVLIAGADRARPAESLYFTVNSLLTARTRYRHCLQISRPLWCVVRCVVNIITHPTVSQPWPAPGLPATVAAAAETPRLLPAQSSDHRESAFTPEPGPGHWTLIQLPTDTERGVGNS